MQPHWFSRPSEGSAGRLNLCYGALDHRVIAGDAEATALITPTAQRSIAATLSEVAAVAGLLRGLGAGLGTTVRCHLVDPLTDPATAIVVELAALRLGAVIVDDGLAGIGVTDTEATPIGDAGVWLVRGVPVLDDRTQIDWEIGLRAGREDPAPCTDVPGDAPAWVRGGRAVASAEALDDDSPLGRRLATLTAGGAVEL